MNLHDLLKARHSTGLPATILHANHAPFSARRQEGRQKKIAQRCAANREKIRSKAAFSAVVPFDRRRFGRTEGQGYKKKRARPINDLRNFIKRAAHYPTLKRVTCSRMFRPGWFFEDSFAENRLDRYFNIQRDTTRDLRRESAR